MSRAASFVAVLAVLTLAVLSLPVAPAQAHATLVSTSPTDGSTVQNEPKKVSFTFNENIRTPAYVVVTAPDGTRIEVGEPKVVDNTVTQRVEHSGIAGKYTASYRVVSTDGHPIEGTISYIVESGRPLTAEESEAQTPNDEDDSFLAGSAVYLLGGLGAVVIVGILLLWPRSRDDA